MFGGYTCAFTYTGPFARNSMPNDLHAVTDPGLKKRLLQDTFFSVWLSVFADNTDYSVMHPMTYICNRHTVNSISYDGHDALM